VDVHEREHESSEAGIEPEVGGRIGARVQAPGMVLTVLVPGGSRLRPHRVRPVEARVVDLSVTGARLDLAPSVTVASGARLDVRHGRSCGSIVVRHQTRTPAGVQCGVEFVHLDGSLRDEVYAIVAGARREQDWRWEAHR
jgi:hypothetical protein